jgi:hypothetical protein
MQNKGGFLAMIMSVLGIVLYCSMFSSILTAFETVRTYANISTFTALSTVVTIAPTVLLLAGLLGAGIAYAMGYKSVNEGGGDASGLLRMVMGILTIILFVTMFSSILTSMYTLYSNVSATNYTAFQTVVQITPTILFLSGIFAGGMTAYGGYKARKSRGAMRLA